MKTEHKAIIKLFYFMSTNRNTRARLVCCLTKMADAERSFEERFSEMARQFSVIYDNDSFSLDTS